MLEPSFILRVLAVAAAFTIIALASRQIGIAFRKASLPLISGFLVTGMVAGPYVLGLISPDGLEQLRIVDQIALAFIAFAAGAELRMNELREHVRGILFVTALLVASTLLLGCTAFYLLAPRVPPLGDMAPAAKLAAALLAGAILVARSPSSAIALVKELRARGPFTRIVLGVTMVSDVVVIILFAVSSSLADALLTDLGFEATEVLLLAAELAAALAIAWILGRVIAATLGLRIPRAVKIAVVLALGDAVFVGAASLRGWTHDLGHELLIEPLLVCMAAGFYVANYSDYRGLFWKTLHDVGPPIYVAFFTLTGAALELDVLGATWTIALGLTLVRLAAIVLGSWLGGAMAGQPAAHRRVAWMTYITQAGVGLGLAKEVASEFPPWGSPFATTMIAVIVVNQLVGPPLFKWAMKHVGESHTRGESEEFDGLRDAVIVGLEDQSLALAMQLRSHGWEVRIATLADEETARVIGADEQVQVLAELSLQELDKLDIGRAEAVVAMLGDEDNYRICEIVYENYGDVDLIVRLDERPEDSPARRLERFHEIGAVTVDPSTAMVSLMDHMVRAPAATSILLGLEEGRDMVEIKVRNPALHGIELRHLRLPQDTIVMSVRRDDEIVISHGYTSLHLGDEVTVLGSESALEEVARKFEG